MSAKIRHSTSSDVDKFRELRLEALKNHPSAFGADYERSAACSIEYWHERLNIDKAQEALFFAEDNEYLAGMAGIFRGPSKKSYHSSTLWGVYVRPEWRGNQLSERLLRSCLTWAKDQKLAVVKLAVVTTNQSAIRCYGHCGFTIYGTEPKALFYNGIYYDEHLMSIEVDTRTP